MLIRAVQMRQPLLETLAITSSDFTKVKRITEEKYSRTFK